MAPPTTRVLDRDVLIPLGLVSAIVLAVAAGASWMNAQFISAGIDSKFAEQEVRFVRMENTIGRIKDKVDLLASQDGTPAGPVRYTEFQSWAELLQARNPELDVPRIENR